MASLIEDQAAGLRRLFCRAREPVRIAFAGSRDATPKAVLIAGLARGLAAAGKEIIILDEQSGGDSVTSAFGVATRFDLLQAVNCDVPLEQVVHQPEAGIRLVPAARAARESVRLDRVQRRALSESLHRLQKGADFLLVDTACRGEGVVSPLLPEAERVVIVSAASSLAITEAYAQIKRLARVPAENTAGRCFDVVITRAGSRKEGEIVFGNLRDVARNHLGVTLRLLACLPARGDARAACGALAETLLRASRPKAALFDGAANGRQFGQAPGVTAMANPVV
jgi:flagellar biosynthesis protein FlhG